MPCSSLQVEEAEDRLSDLESEATVSTEAERLTAARAELAELTAALLAARTDTALHVHEAAQQSQAAAVLQQHIRSQQVSIACLSCTWLVFFTGRG